MILGSYDGIVSIGEFRNVWQALRTNELCGCSAPVSLCKFWTAVGARAYGGWETIDIDAMINADDKFARHRSIPRHIVLRRLLRDTSDLGAYREALGRLYDAIQEISGSRIIVDSTKRASYAYVLRDVPGIDLRVVHLVRDSRGVAFSNAKAQIIRPELEHPASAEPVYMSAQPLWRTAIDWEVKNLLFYPLVRPSKRRRVKYEDLVAHPSEELSAIVEFAGADRDEHGSWDAATCSFESLPHHTLGGNPVRFRRGRVRLEPDDEWKFKMSRGQKALVSTITFPLLLAYGYPILARRNQTSGCTHHMRTLARRHKA
jgi:hypothetical protein